MRRCGPRPVTIETSCGATPRLPAIDALARKRPSDVEFLRELVQPKHAEQGSRCHDRHLVPVREHLPTAGTRVALVEPAVGAIGARHRMIEIGRRIGREVLLGELAAIARLGEVAVDQAGRDAVGQDRLHRREAHPNVSAAVGRGEVDRPGRYFRLVDWRYRLGLLAHLVHRPVELGRVDGGQVHHRDMDVQLVVDDLRAEAVGEAADGRLGAAIDRLQRNRTVGQRGADVDDGAAVARPHARQRGHHAMHLAEIGDVGTALDLGGGELADRREHRRHRDVDPGDDRAEFGFRLIRRSLDSIGVGNIGRHAIARMP